MDDKQKAVKDINTLISQVGHLLDLAQNLADEYEVEFSYDGPARGFGGWYEPCPEGEDPDEKCPYSYQPKYGWRASSHDC